MVSRFSSIKCPRNRIFRVKVVLIRVNVIKENPMTRHFAVSILICFAVYLIVCSTVAAQEEGGDPPDPEAPSAPADRNDEGAEKPSDRVIKMGEMLVVGREEERNLLETPLIESSSLEIATSIVDRQSIEIMNAGSLTDAVDLAPGVLTETRGRKEKSFSSVRGQIYPYPDYAINGVWQRAFRSFPSFFPAAAIERVEVLRSGGAIMVGPNSGLVGAFNIVTRRFDTPTALLDAQAGSFNTYRASAVYGSRFSEGDYTAGVNLYSTAGPEEENAAEQFTSVFGTGGWDPADSVHMELSLLGMSGSRELRIIQDPGSTKFQKRIEEFSPMSSYGGVLRTVVKNGTSSSTEFDIGHVSRQMDYHREQDGKPDYDHADDDWEHNLGVIHTQELSDVNTLRAGLQYHRWVCPDGKRFFVGNRMDVETFSAVVMDEHEWDRMVLDGGLRLTRSWYRDYVDTTFNIVGNRLASRTIEHEWGDPAATGTAGIKYLLNNEYSLFGHAAFGSVDAPPGAAAEDGGDMDRETRTIIDGGVRYENRRIGVFSAGLFTTLRNDAVMLADTKITEDGETFNTYANDDMRHYGIELEARSAMIADSLSLFANVTFMESERRIDGDWEKYEEIPDWIIGAGGTFTVDRYDLNIFAKYVGAYENKRFSDDGGYHALGNFVDINVTGGAVFGQDRATRVFIALENLLNDEYSTVVGYPDYGLQVSLGVQHRM